ncbi:MAG: cold-shock protein [Phototrophicaceae bacterium]|jgi:CspA family cold shock protein
MAAQVTGTVKWYNASSGYGVITQDGGGDVYVAAANIKGGSLNAGQRVSFVVTTTSRGKEAVNVSAG